MTSMAGSRAARGAAITLLLVSLSMLSSAQNDNSQGNEGDYPVVPVNQSGIRPHVWVHKKIGPNVTQAATQYLDPAQLTAAYGMNTVPGLGKNATIAIVDAYDGPNGAGDLAYFMSTWGVSCPGGGGTFTKLNQYGQTTPLPGPNSDWEVEISLDVQWARSVAPCANIILVEANSSNLSDLLAAVSKAASMASVVSMSWGSTEFSGETSFDSTFATPGVTFLASSGDTGGVVSWPSSSTNVIAVGGTNLSLDSNNNVLAETAWSGSGGGCSTQESPIGPQAGFVPSSCTMRAVPDISTDGGDQSPVYVYISDQGGWYAVYGTSLAVQLAGASVGLANGMRATAGNSVLNGTLADLYSDASGTAYSSNFRDITSGTAGSFTAGPGWDFVTGVGSMLVNNLVPNYLATQGLSPDFSISATPGSQTVTQGKATTYSANLGSINNFSGSVTLSAGSTPQGVTVSFNPTSGTEPVPGTSTVNVTTGSTTPAGTYTLTFTGTGPSSSHSTTVTLVVTAAPKPDFSISKNPSSLSVTQGNSNTSTINLTSINGFANPVTLSVKSGCPATCTFSANPVTPNGSSVLTISTTSSTPAGGYTLTVQGYDSLTNTTHTTTVNVTVVAVVGDFTLAATNLTVTRPNTNFETISVGQVGASSTVSLSVSGLPSNTTASFSPSSSVTTPGSVQLTILARNKARAGNYTITVSGTNETYAHKTTFTLTIK